MSSCNRMCATVYGWRHLVNTMEVTTGLAESNGSLLPAWLRRSIRLLMFLVLLMSTLVIQVKQSVRCVTCLCVRNMTFERNNQTRYVVARRYASSRRQFDGRPFWPLSVWPYCHCVGHSACGFLLVFFSNHIPQMYWWTAAGLRQHRLRGPG